MRDRLPSAYIMANGVRGTLYVGVTSDLMARVHQHREGTSGGFTSRYRVNRLVYFEMFDDMTSAIAREKQLKNWHREWKINLIERDNPRWEDLAATFGFDPLPPKKLIGRP